MTERRLVFLVAGRRYALPLAGVLEVIRPEPHAWIPNVPPAVLGIANFRGRTLPLADGALLLRHDRPVEPGEAVRILVVAHPELQGTPVGILVERVAGIRTVDPAALRPRDELAGRALHAAVCGIEPTDAGSVLHLDLALLLGRPDA